MPITQITDHAEKMVERLLWQFRERPNIATIMAIHGARYQGLEDMLFALTLNRSINDATGAQLDAIATIVGVERPASGLAATDETAYRDYLRAKVIANRAEGDPEDLYRILRKVGSLRTQLVEYAYKESEVVKVRLATKGAITTSYPVAMDLLRQAGAAGVRLELSGNEVWWEDRLWGADDVWPEYSYTDGPWTKDGLWGDSAYWGGDLTA